MMLRNNVREIGIRKVLHLKNSNLYSLQIFVPMKILISVSIFDTTREK